MPRTSMFGPRHVRSEGKLISAWLGFDGAARFEVSRTDVAVLYRKVAGKAWTPYPSDADVIDYLTLGPRRTRAAFKRQVRR